MNNNLNSTLKFYGNPAGLGNRYEELARLSKFAEYENLYVDYFWNNSFKFKISETNSKSYISRVISPCSFIIK